MHRYAPFDELGSHQVGGTNFLKAQFGVGVNVPTNSSNGWNSRNQVGDEVHNRAFGALMGDEDSGQFGPELFASPEQYEQFLTLWNRRWNEVVTALDAQVDNLEDARAYAPEVMDVRGAVAAMSESERAEMADELADQELPYFAQVWALGFMFVVETWPEEWAAPRDKEAREWLEDALNRIITLTEDDDGEPVISMFGEDSPPSVSQARINAYGDAIWAAYDLRDLWKSIGPRVEQVVKGDEPGRNDPCSCGSGKKYKKCCGAN